MNLSGSLRLFVGAAAVLAAPVIHAQTAGAALDAAWVTVCANAQPGTPFFQRCQEILNAGPGSGDRRSDAALGNNLNTVSSQGRMANAANGDIGRIDWAAGGAFLGVTARDTDRTGRAADAGYDGSMLGVVVGVDRRFNDRHVVGLAFNHQRESAHFEAGAGRVRGRNLGLIATYGTSLGDAWTVDAYAGALRGNLDLTRRVAYELLLNAGTPAQSTVRVQGLAETDTDTRRNVAGASLGYLLSRNAWQWQFGAGVDIVRSRIDDYVEQGGAGLALVVDAQRISSRQGRLGMRGARTASTFFGVLQPFLALDLMHEFADDSREVQVAFAGDPGLNRIGFATARPDRNWAEAGVGLEATMTGGSAAFIEYRQRFGDTWLDERALSLGFRVEFD
jgi:outer membrane autotransporter protein